VWILKYLGCLIQGHSFVDIYSESGHRHYYQYCLRCGKARGLELAAQPVAAGELRK
jgi:hypothetical protein